MLKFRHSSLFCLQLFVFKKVPRRCPRKWGVRAVLTMFKYKQIFSRAGFPYLLSYFPFKLFTDPKLIIINTLCEEFVTVYRGGMLVYTS